MCSQTALPTLDWSRLFLKYYYRIFFISISPTLSPRRTQIQLTADQLLTNINTAAFGQLLGDVTTDKVSQYIDSVINTSSKFSIFFSL